MTSAPGGQPGDGAAATALPRTKPSHLRTKRGIQAGLGLALGASLLIWGLPYFAKTSWSDVFVVIRQIPLSHALLYQLIMLAGLYCYTFTITGAMPGISHPRALILNVCGSSVGNLLPGGGAVGLAATYSICRSWGFGARRVSTMAIVTGVWNVLARIALPVIAIIALYIGNTGLPRVLTDAALAGSIGGLALLVAFVAVLASERAALLIGRGLDRVLGPAIRRARPGSAMKVEAVVRDMRAQTNELVRDHWVSLTLGMVGFLGIYFVLFVLIARDTGVDLPYGQLFAAYAIGRLLTAVGITPGGIGVTETVAAATLVAWGADPAASTATVLLFTVFTHVMEVPLGALGWVAWSILPKTPSTDAD